jgi:hypothetical protein
MIGFRPFSIIRSPTIPTFRRPHGDGKELRCNLTDPAEYAKLHLSSFPSLPSNHQDWRRIQIDFIRCRLNVMHVPLCPESISAHLHLYVSRVFSVSPYHRPTLCQACVGNTTERALLFIKFPIQTIRDTYPALRACGCLNHHDISKRGFCPVGGRGQECHASRNLNTRRSVRIP